MAIRHSLLAACCVLLTLGQAQAMPITFNATGVAGISGYVQFDDSVFDGSQYQALPNTEITALDLNVFGALFSLADVDTGAFTVIDSSGFSSLLPLIVNGEGGNLADNGNQAIAFYPDGFGGTFDGDASLAVGASGSLAGESLNDVFYDVQWVAAAAAVPEPATAAIFALGLFGLWMIRARRQAPAARR